MLDLEQCASVLSVLDTLICQAERTPALGQPGWGEWALWRKPSCQGEVWAAVTAVTPHRRYVTAWEAALEKGSCQFCSSGLARAAAHLVGGAGCQRTLIMETEPFPALV